MPDTPKPLFLVTFPENPGFLGRTADLDRLNTALQQHTTNGEAVGIVPAGVTGMGGIGKTQLAVKYVYTYRDHYPDGIYWLNGANSLYQEFADLGRKLQGIQSDLIQRQQLLDWLDAYYNESDLQRLCFHVGVNFEDLPPGGRLDKARELVAHMDRQGKLDILENFLRRERPALVTEKREIRRDPALDELVGTAFTWLDQRPRALLVLDNLEQPERLQEPVSRDWVPARLACPLLFTTRQRQLRGAQAIELTVLPLKVAMQLLLRHRPQILQVDHPEHKTAQAICHMVGYLPLALEVAGAQLKQLFDVSLADYQAELEAGGLLSILTDERTPVEVRHEMGLKAVLASQWRRLPQPEMRQLLRVAGQIPEAAQIPGPRLGLLAGIPEKGQSIFDVTLTRALNTLVDASLVERLEGDLVRLHPLVRDFARQQVAEAEQELFRQQCVLNLVKTFEDVALLEEQCRQRGMDALQEDLLTALDWLEPLQATSQEPLGIPPWRKLTYMRQAATSDGAATPQRLRNLLRLVQQEIHTLRRWQPEQQPTFFGQQIVFRLQALGLKALFDRSLATLQRQLQPHWHTRWTKKQESLALERTLTGHSHGVRAVAVTPDGRRAISASYDQTLKVWDLQTGAEERTLTGHSHGVRAVAVTPDGRRAISASEDKTLKVWDLSTGKELASIVLDGSLDCLAVATDGLTIVTGDGAGSVYCLRYEEPGAAASVSASLLN